MIHKTVSQCVFVLFLFLKTVFCASPGRMDLFDNSGNNLMFVLFEYDINGRNIGRSVYAADSTFLRKTTFTEDGSGKRTREQSLNFNDDTIGYTVFNQNTSPVMNVFDQFGLNQFGASFSYTANGENTYDIYHNDRSVYKMKYTFSPDGNPDRIDIQDMNGQMLYYAKFSSIVKTINRIPDKSFKPEISVSGNFCRISIFLNKESFLNVFLYTISGQFVSAPFSGKYNAGLHTFRFEINGTNIKKLASALYLLRFYADEQEVATPRKLYVSKR